MGALALMMIVGFGVGMVFAPFWQLLKAATGRGHFDDVDWMTPPMGLALLGFVFLAVWAVVTQWDQAWAEYFHPFREVGTWFS